MLNQLFPAAPEVVSWLGFVAPSGAPDAAIAKLSAVIMEAEQDPVFIAKLEKIGVEPIVHTPAQFRQQVVEENAKWKELLPAIEARQSN